jgi:hypothetical protein
MIYALPRAGYSTFIIPASAIDFSARRSGPRTTNERAALAVVHEGGQEKEKAKRGIRPVGFVVVVII